MKTTETVTLPLFFFVSFHLVWRCFFQQRFAQKCNVGVCAVFINFQCFVCALIFLRVIFVCWLCSCSCDFVSFVKIFNMQLQGVLGIFQQRFVQKCNVGVSLQFSSVFNVFCAVIFRRVIFVCWLCSCSCDFVLRKNFQYAVARCVGYFSTTFCAEMQCRCFFAVFINFQCFV